MRVAVHTVSFGIVGSIDDDVDIFAGMVAW
jgi:hypothetical protein